MPIKSRERIYWDSCCWLSYLNNIPERMPVLDDILANNASEKGMIRLHTSVISKVEVAFNAFEQRNGELDPIIENQIDSLWADRETIKLIEYHEIIGNEAKHLMRAAVSRKWNLKPIDAIHLATAKSISAISFHTYDKDLFKYSEMINIPIINPQTDSPRLL